MRGGDYRTGELFSYVDLGARVRRDHPLRAIRTIVNEVLSTLEREFSALHSPIGRPSVPPERLVRAMLLQVFYSICSERLLMERLEYDLLFRWFVGIGVDDAVWGNSVFSKNRDRLLEGDIGAKFLVAVLAQPKVKKLLSSDHFSLDGTLIEAWGLDEEHQARTVLASRRLSAAVAMRKRTSMARNARATPMPRPLIRMPGSTAGIKARRRSCASSADRPTAITHGADKAYDAERFINELRSMTVTPHVPQKIRGRSSAINGRTTRHGRYAVNQRIRKRIEEAFGWMNTIAGQEKTSFRGRDRMGWAFTFAAAAYNLVRLPKLIAEAG